VGVLAGAAGWMDVLADPAGWWCQGPLTPAREGRGDFTFASGSSSQRRKCSQADIECSGIAV
jgi:hypothetical protein